MSRFNTFVLTALILASATLIGIHAEVWSGNRTSSSKAPSGLGVKAKLDWASSKDEPTKKIYSLFETKEQYSFPPRTTLLGA